MTNYNSDNNEERIIGLSSFSSSSINRGSNRFEKNLHKYIEFISWARWHPDLWYDLITPESGGIRLDLDQRVFLRAIARFVSVYGVFPRGYGKCVTGDSLIITSDGIKEIGEYFNYNKSNKEFYQSRIINVANRNGSLEVSSMGVYSGYLPTIRVTTEEGFEIEGTKDHPILTISKQGRLKWKLLSEISTSDYVVISRNTDIWGKNNKLKVDIKQLRGQTELNITDELSEEFALILGYLIGSGDLDKDNNRIRFTFKDRDVVQNLKGFLEGKLGMKVRKISKYGYCVSGEYANEYFRQIGLNQKLSERVVPKCILESPKPIVSSFVQGLFDTGGDISNSLLEFNTLSKRLADQLQIILLNFGIVSTKKIKYSKETIFYNLTINGKNIDIFKKEIGFSCNKKQKKLNDICNKKINMSKEIIPFQKEIVNVLYNEIKVYNEHIYDEIQYIINGISSLTYDKLQYLLSLDGIKFSSAYNDLKEICDNNYFFSKVNEITSGRGHVYDLCVPETNSFISNGIISHNTFLEVLGMFHTAIFYPDIEIAMSAQTQESAAKILRDKYDEIIKFYPLLENEIEGKNFSKDGAEIRFLSGGVVNILANQQSSKGQRRKRLNIEESALLNNELFQDVLEPIPNVPRRTIGKKGLVNPEELNGQINFFTTSGFRGSDEFERNVTMVKEMAELKGKIVLGADWQLAVHYGRGEPRSAILDKKSRLSPSFFARNYESRWVGATSGAIVDINKLLSLRTLERHELESNGRDEYILSVDVARSQSESNNQTFISVLKIKRKSNGQIASISLVNLINLPNGLTFSDQSIEIKRIKRQYRAKVVVVDINGLGVGLLDELIKEHFDPDTGDSLGCWGTLNTDHKPESQNYERIIYALHSQGINHEIIINFIDMVESRKLQLLVKSDNNDYDANDTNYFKNNVLPYVHTDLLIEEVANLKLKPLKSGKFTVEQLTSRVGKDRYSSVAYGLWYIKEFENEEVEHSNSNILDYLHVG